MKIIKGFRGEYFFLSNFYECDVTICDCNFGSVETAFQAMKSYDLDIVYSFEGLSPKEAKARGRKVELRSDWEYIKVDLMHRLIMNKFTENKDLKDKLLATGNSPIIEENNWGDTFWGVCGGKGKNMLGRILMQVRYELANDVRLPYCNKL